MKHEIIKTDNYLLVVDDSEIKTWYYDEYSKKVYHSGGAEYSHNDITKNIVAHLPLNGYAILKDIPLLPPLENEDDFHPIDEYDKEYRSSLTFDGKSFVSDVLLATRLGYNKAREKYKFTEEDVKKAIELATTSKHDHRLEFYSKEEIIKSLSQPKTPTHFEASGVVETYTGDYNPVMLGTYIYEGGEQ